MRSLTGVAVTKYTSGDGKGVLDDALLDEAFRGTKEADLHEFWVDGQGRLRQYYNEHYMVVHYEGSAEGKTRGGPPRVLGGWARATAPVLQ